MQMIETGRPSDNERVFASFLDNQLVLPTKDMPKQRYEPLRRALNWYCLFNSELYVLDLSLLFNKSMRILIEHDGYEKLLDAGVITPLLRDEHLGEPVDSFSRLVPLLIKSGTYSCRQVPTDWVKAYARVLDEICSAKAVINYLDCSNKMQLAFENTLLDNLWATDNGLGAVAPRLHEFIRQWLVDHPGQTLRRTTFFDFADSLTGRKDRTAARNIRLFSAVIYNSTFRHHLDCVPAFPRSYLPTLHRFEPISITEPELNHRIMQELVPEALRRVAPCDFALLKPDAILEIRSKGKDYFSALSRVSADPASETARREFTETASKYVDLIYEALGEVEVPGARPKIREAAKSYTIVTIMNFLGGIAIVLATAKVHPYLSIAGGITWLFLSAKIDSWAKQRRNETLRSVTKAHQSLHYRVLNVYHPTRSPGSSGSQGDG